MKRSIYHILSILILSTVLIACGKQSKNDGQKTNEKDEIVKEGSHEVIFENDYAKVTKVSLDAGEMLKPHQGKQRIIYSLTDYAIDWEENGKNEGQKSWKKGDVHAHSAGQHSAKNNGNTKAEWLVFTKKEATLPDCDESKIEEDVNAVSENFAVEKLDNVNFRVTEINLPQGESLPRHEGVNRIIYSLSDYQITFNSADAENIEKQFKTGDVHWHNACQHAIDNTGETDAKFLVVAFK